VPLLTMTVDLVDGVVTVRIEMPVLKSLFASGAWQSQSLIKVAIEEQAP
jgi:hypothetical protein